MVVISRRVFPFEGLVGGQRQRTNMVKQLDSSGADQRRAEVWVRLHMLEFPGPSNPIEVRVVVRQYSQDESDPGQDFIGAVVGAVTISDADTAPGAATLKVVDLDVPLGPMLRFDVEAENTSTVSTPANARAEISVGITFRSSN